MPVVVRNCVESSPACSTFQFTSPWNEKATTTLVYNFKSEKSFGPDLLVVLSTECRFFLLFSDVPVLLSNLLWSTATGFKKGLTSRDKILHVWIWKQGRDQSSDRVLLLVHKVDTWHTSVLVITTATLSWWEFFFLTGAKNLFVEYFLSEEAKRNERTERTQSRRTNNLVSQIPKAGILSKMKVPMALRDAFWRGCRRFQLLRVSANESLGSY